MTYYTQRYSDTTDLTKFSYAVHYDSGITLITDKHNADEWTAKGNTLTKESGNRFILINNGVVSLDPNMAAILAAEKAAEDARLARAQEIIDDLPSWETISTAIDNATTLAQLKVIVKKAIRVIYIHIRMGES